MNLVKLEDISIVSTGQSAPQDLDAFSDNGVPFIRAGSLESLLNGASESDLELIEESKAKKYKLRLFPKNTIIFAKSGMSAKISRVYQLKGPCFVVSHLATIIPNEKVYANYLTYWLRYNPPSKLIENESYPSIKTSMIQKLEIVLPSLIEQRRVAAILDKADEIRQKRQQSIKKLDELLQSTFIDMFGDPITNPKGWEAKEMGSFCSFENGDRSSNYPNATEIQDSGIPFLSTKNIVKNSYNETKLNFITEEKFSELTRGKAKNGDILITLRGTLGAVCIFNSKHKLAFINAQMMIIRSDDIVMSNKFLHAILSFPTFQTYFSRIGQGAAVQQLTTKQFEKISIIVPSKFDQDLFLRKADYIQAQKVRLTSQLALFDALFLSLQQRVFNGTL